MKFLKWISAGALACGLLLSGCAKPVPVTEDNAPSELLKKAAAISSESTMDDIVEVFQGMVDQTYDANPTGLVYDESGTSTSIDTLSDKLEGTKTSLRSYDIRVPAKDRFYQLYEYSLKDETEPKAKEKSSSESSSVESGSENGSAAENADQASNNQQISGLSEYSPYGETVVYTSLADGVRIAGANDPMTITSISSYENENAAVEADQLDSAIENSVVYALYSMFGSNLLLQPLEYPDLYDFTLAKIGNEYRWTISMADAEAYNTQLDSVYESSYGMSRLDIRGDGTLVLDGYDLEDVRLVLTTDANGALKKIENITRSKATLGEDSLDLSSNDTVADSAAPESWMTFFEGFFTSVKGESLKEGDTFKLLQKFDVKKADSSASSQEKASSEASSKAESAANESKADAKSESKEESKADSKADSKAESKTESKADSKADSSKK